MTEKVLFTAMEHGTQSDYDIVNAHHAKFAEMQGNFSEAGEMKNIRK